MSEQYSEEQLAEFRQQMAHSLRTGLGYSAQEADAMVAEYWQKFTDAAYCRSIGVPVQDAEYFFHEAPSGMALRAHYYLGIKGDPDPHSYFEWRTAYYRRHEGS